VQFLSSDGAPSSVALTATNTLCDHAMLLGEDEIFVIPDMTKDWRFQQFNFRCKKGELMRFYASAPIMLSNSEEGSQEKKEVQVGRLTIMRLEPWSEFGEEDADLLMDIAKMTQEALENEFLHSHAQKVQQMQRETAYLSWQLNLAADEEITQDKAQDSKLGVLLCPPRMQSVVDLVKRMVGASTVAAIDVADYHLQNTRSDPSFSYTSSPRSSKHYGSYPSMPWLSSSSSGTTPSSESGITSPYREQSDISADSDTVPSDLESAASDPNKKLRSPHTRSTSVAGSLEDAERYNLSPGGAVNIIASAGDEANLPSISSTSQVYELGSLLTRVRKDKKLSKPRIFDNQLESDTSDEEEEEESDNDLKNPLGSLMPSTTKSYCAIPIYANDRIQPLFLYLVTFDHKKVLPESERLFMYSIGVITAATSLRQQARLADRAQLDFIRSVQHELRTPLNGILGITDFLRQNLASEQKTEKLDLTEDGLLANLLESIRLSGVNLSTILDDVLDFGGLSGLRGRDVAPHRIEEIDLVREVEDGCLDELEHIAMHERQDQQMKVYRGYYAVPTLVIKVAPELQTRFRTDRAKVKKILSKFVANSLRYSNEQELVEVTVVPSRLTRTQREHNTSADRWIDFIVEDTGMGMSQEFLSNSLFKPFSKADSFSQGVGLGVTIAASLISQMGGRLHIQSELGKGTRVQVSLPFGHRPALVSRNSLSHFNRPYQVKKACFFGFVLKGQKKIVEMIQERLIANGIQIVDADQKADLVILKETALARKSEEDDQELTTDPKTLPSTWNIPRPIGPKARVLVVTRNALRSRNSSVLEGLPVWLFRPPFGPSSLDAMDDFLREDSPIVLKSVPTPTAAAKDNMKKVQEKQTKVVQQDVMVDEEANVDRRSDIKTSPTPPAPDKMASKELEIIASPAKEAADDMERKDKPFRVLVVEDNYVNMRLITAVLQKGGFTFAEAKDGVEAVEQYKAFQPSVVLLDISLPLMDGFEACIQMRAHQMTHFPKIIAITALSSNEDKIKGLEVCGMDDWRTKPLSIKTLRTDLVAWKKEWDQVWSLDAHDSSIKDPVRAQAQIAVS